MDSTLSGGAAPRLLPSARRLPPGDARGVPSARVHLAVVSMKPFRHLARTAWCRLSDL
jgi:hypothetical protein